MKIVDANLILRYLLNDIEEQSKEALSILNSGSISLLNEVIAEIVYVLEKVYKVDRNFSSGVKFRLFSILLF